MIEVRWLGRGGQGGFTAARLLGLSAALFENRHALAFPSFGPERRGAPVFGYTRIDDRKITDRSAVTECSHIVVLDESLITRSVTEGLKPGGLVVINTPSAERYHALLGKVKLASIDATALAVEILGKPISNTAMLGALIAFTGVVRLESAISGIQAEMHSGLAEKNIELIKAAYEAAGGVAN